MSLTAQEAKLIQNLESKVAQLEARVNQSALKLAHHEGYGVAAAAAHSVAQEVRERIYPFYTNGHERNRVLEKVLTDIAIERGLVLP